MPETAVYFFRDDDGTAPVLEWLATLHQQNRWAHAYCVARIRLVAEMGRELRHPHAEHLRDGVSELRTRIGRVRYRLLYSFHGRDVAVLGHGVATEDKTPDADIERAIERRKRYEEDPDGHRYLQGKPATAKQTADALTILARSVADDQEQRERIEKAALNCRVAQLIYDARTDAGLTQAQLAERIRTTQQTIARLENTHYEGHSLATLHRIAAALDRPLQISLGLPARHIQTE